MFQRMSSRFRKSGSVGLALAGLIGLVAAGSSVPASAATKTTKKSTKAVLAPTFNPCPTGRVTTVAAMTNRKFGATIKVYNEPNENEQPKNTLAVGAELAGVIVFTVNRTEGAWMNVNIPVRPTGATGWIKASEVHTYQHGYWININLNRRQLTVCNAGRVIQQEKVGIGAPNQPTPTGIFYTADLIKPKGGPNGAYGPFAFGLSGYSEVVFNFAGGDGRLGIHGTNAPTKLGTPVSAGCIRVANTGITKMAKTLPLGVPVEIVTA